jgi:Family of unknown function (DUF6166)
MSSPSSRPPRPPARMIVDDLEWSMPQRGTPCGVPRRLRVWMFPDGTRLAVITDRGTGEPAKTVAELAFVSLHRRWPDNPEKLRIIEHYPRQLHRREFFEEVTLDEAGIPVWHPMSTQQLISWCGTGVLDDMPELPPDPEFSDVSAIPSPAHDLPDGPGIDDSTVICGYPSSSSDALVLFETLDGEPLGPLPHHIKDSPQGYGWGYIGTGPSDLARSILVAVLGCDARCKTCGGTGQTRDDADADHPGTVERPTPTRLARCPRCTNGIAAPWVDRFRREYVARWPIDQPWRIAGGEIRAWLADLNSRPQL